MSTLGFLGLGIEMMKAASSDPARRFCSVCSEPNPPIEDSCIGEPGLREKKGDSLVAHKSRRPFAPMPLHAHVACAPRPSRLQARR